MDKMKQQSGFTLIELVVVIVILGILAATALPKFVDLAGDARRAAAQGLVGAVSSAMNMAYAKALARNQSGTTGNIDLDGVPTAVAFGYPTLATIDNFLQDDAGADYSETAGTWTFRTNCVVTYTAATGANAPATVVFTNEAGC